MLQFFTTKIMLDYAVQNLPPVKCLITSTIKNANQSSTLLKTLFKNSLKPTIQKTFKTLSDLVSYTKYASRYSRYIDKQARFFGCISSNYADAGLCGIMRCILAPLPVTPLGGGGKRSLVAAGAAGQTVAVAGENQTRHRLLLHLSAAGISLIKHRNLCHSEILFTD